MSADGPHGAEGDRFDVVLLHSPTEDGEGARVLRARPGRIDAGEVRPMVDGRPIIAGAGAEVVRLERRTDAPAVFDVHVECAIPSGGKAEGRAEGKTEVRAEGKAERPLTPAAGPPQVATRAYRENWELTFGARRGRSVN